MAGMNTIDQRILIPSPQTAVWDFLSDLSRNPQWMIDCQSVAFLTTKRQGTATRFRCQDAKGRDSIVEISAWYNGLGYEYVYVDGSPYRENRGRIRLQEIPEGTIVQWTFHYEIGGMFSSVRNPGRQIETTMANSLKNLYRQITQQSKEFRESKSLMRDAPDVRERSQYQPRYPTANPATAASAGGTSEPVQVPPISTAEFMLSELEMQLAADPFAPPPVRPDDAQVYRPADFSFDVPPVQEGDTRPNPAARVAPAEPAPSASEVTHTEIAEPDFLDELIDDRRFAPPASEPQPASMSFDFTDDNIPLAAANPADAALIGDLFDEVESSKTEVPPAQLADLVNEPSASSADIFAFDDEPASADIVSAAAAPVEAASEPAAPLPLPKALEPTPSPPPPEPAVTEESFKSIWEIFGVERPSESQQMRAITEQQIADADAKDLLDSIGSQVTETLAQVPPVASPDVSAKLADENAETIPSPAAEAASTAAAAEQDALSAATEAVTAAHDLVDKLVSATAQTDSVVSSEAAAEVKESAIETESLAAVPATVISARTSAEPAPEIALHQGRIGLRLILRKRLIRLRHPI
ncbi:hypothetical protein FBR02_02110 [Anaerolineae bacterium CFX9]|nr:hypothetical protein [Anaerolineae bacterium CFX9]